MSLSCVDYDGSSIRKLLMYIHTNYATYLPSSFIDVCLYWSEEKYRFIIIIIIIIII